MHQSVATSAAGFGGAVTGAGEGTAGALDGAGEHAGAGAGTDAAAGAVDVVELDADGAGWQPSASEVSGAVSTYLVFTSG